MKFRCLQTQRVIEFTDPQDIESVLRETHYEVVPEVVPEVKPVVKPAKAK